MARGIVQMPSNPTIGSTAQVPTTIPKTWYAGDVAHATLGTVMVTLANSRRLDGFLTDHPTAVRAASVVEPSFNSTRGDHGR
jgi:hypothetical protein